MYFGMYFEGRTVDVLRGNIGTALSNVFNNIGTVLLNSAKLVAAKIVAAL